MTSLSPADVEALVVKALAAIAPDIKGVGPETRLLGSGAVIDSIGFVSLLVSLEELLPLQLDLAGSYLSQPDGDANPFFAVGALSSHVAALAAEHA